MDRVPYRATLAAEPYLRIGRLPVAILLENVRSLYNVGAFFRTADAAAIEKLYLCGITGCPPHNSIAKTALGTETSVPWEHSPEAARVVQDLRLWHHEIAAIETSLHAVDLFDWQPRFPVCLLFGNEIDGLQPEIAQLADTHVRIPMLGIKHSLNVATAGGIVIYELLRKYRRMAEVNLAGTS
ncbi:MAG: TrmH family RNA methyltransferase [Acidobacteriota bacterium]|nr:TrmH family RNA methyltransferase [Acidobacteriota bacterium]